jgi:hypothetical protein
MGRTICIRGWGRRLSSENGGYTYTYNNPLMLVDPTGEEPIPSSLRMDVRMFRERTEKRIAAWGKHPQSAPNTAQPALDQVSLAGSDPGEYGGADDWLELSCPSGGCTIALHQAAKSQKGGSAIKLVFAVADVEAFVRTKEQEGLTFGVIHHPDGFEFSNARDPPGNSISVSSRGL